MKYLKILLIIIIFGATSVLQAADLRIVKGKLSTFKAQSRDGQEKFEWIFPGGERIDGRIVQYAFSEAGQYQITLKVTDKFGETNETTKNILVYNLDKPTAVISATVDDVTVVGRTVHARLGQKILLRPSSDAEIGEYDTEWRVNDQVFPQSQLKNIFNQIGTYRVDFIVFDPANPSLRDQTTLQVLIENTYPVLSSLNFIENPKIPGQIYLKAEAKDPDGYLVNYKFEVLEKGKLVMAQNLPKPEAYFDLGQYPGAHVYNFRVTITDNNNAKISLDANKNFKFEREVYNKPPKFVISVLPGNSGDTDTLFNFSVEATDPDKDAIRYEWVFPDGRRQFSPSFKTQFNYPGDSDVILKVSDGINTVEGKVHMTIYEKKQVQKENQPPKVALKGVLPKQYGDTNTIFRFYLKAEDPDGDRLEYLWDMGDGAQMFVQNPAYRFPKIGEYKVNVAVTDGHFKVVLPVDIVVRELGFEDAKAVDPKLKKELEGEANALGSVNIAGNNKDAEERIKALAEQNRKAEELAEKRKKILQSLVQDEIIAREKERQKNIEDLSNPKKTDQKVLLETQLKKAESDLELLEKIQSENEGGGNEEISTLEKEFATLVSQITAEAQKQIQSKISDLKVAQEGEASSEKKLAIGLEIESLEKYLKSKTFLDDFLPKYKEDLAAQKQKNELALAKTSDEFEKNAIKLKISTTEKQQANLARLKKIKNDLESAKNKNPNAQNELQDKFNEYLQKRLQELLEEKGRIDARLKSETDSVEVTVLKTRRKEVENFLEKLSYVLGARVDIGSITIVSAKQKLEWKRDQIRGILETSTGGEKKLELEEITKQLVVLSSLDNSGLSPDLTIAELKRTLETKKQEVVDIFRKESDPVQMEALRSKILTLEESLKILGMLKNEEISDTVNLENAQRRIHSKRTQLTNAYTAAKDNETRKALLLKIETTNKEYALLGKFYNPNTQQQTLSGAKSFLLKTESETKSKLQATEAPAEQDLYQKQLGKIKHDLMVLQTIETSLQGIIKEQFGETVESYRNELLENLEGVSDPVKKAELQAALEKLNSQNLQNMGTGQINLFEGLIADIIVNTETQVSLYGQMPETAHDRAVLFEWDLGNGKIAHGQNVSVRYRTPGFYRVNLRITDGLTESSDSITIKVISKESTSK